MAETPDQTAPGPTDWPEQTEPLVFMYPPVEYEVVTPERFTEWEGRLTELTGLGVKGGASADSEWTTHLPTFSFCAPNKTNACDSDMT